MLNHTGREEVGVLVFLVVVASLFTGLRLFGRYRSQVLGGDDWMLVVSLLLLYFCVAAGFVAVAIGGSLPKTERTHWQAVSLRKTALASQILYSFVTPCVKISVIWSYHRIFNLIRWVRHVSYIVAVLCIMWGIAVFLTLVLQCRPVHAYWSSVAGPQTCINQRAFLAGESLSNAILTVILLLLPLPPVLGMRMSTGKKVLATLSFLTGGIAAAASIYRTVWAFRYDDGDTPFNLITILEWTYIEPAIGVVAACFPFLSGMISERLLHFASLVKALHSAFRGRSSDGTQISPDLEHGTDSNFSTFTEDSMKITSYSLEKTPSTITLGEFQTDIVQMEPTFPRSR